MIDNSSAFRRGWLALQMNATGHLHNYCTQCRRVVMCLSLLVCLSVCLRVELLKKTKTVRMISYEIREIADFVTISDWLYFE